MDKAKMDALLVQVNRKLILAALAQIENVYVVMTTHPNESAYEIRSVHVTEEGAEEAVNTINDDEVGDGDDPESELEVWCETVRLQE